MDMDSMTVMRPQNRGSRRWPCSGNCLAYWMSGRSASQWALVACGLWLFAAADVQAQTTGTRNAYGTNIVVNNDVLNSLGSTGPAPAIPYREGAGSYLGSERIALHQPGILLFPPPSYPRSQLVHPGAADLTFERRTVPPTTTHVDPPNPEPANKVDIAAVAGETSEGPASGTSEPAAAPDEEQNAEEPTGQASEKEPETSADALQQEPEPIASANAPSEEKTNGAKATPAATMVAAAPPTNDVMASVGFLPSSADLSDEARARLQALAEKLNSNSSGRVQILAYAESDSDSPNAARRLSLSRALVVRGFLIDQGMNATQMQVRALGDRFEEGPPDRVDIRRQGG